MISANAAPTSRSRTPRPSPVSPGRFVLILFDWVGVVEAPVPRPWSGPNADPDGCGCGCWVTTGGVVAVALFVFDLLAACAAGATIAATSASDASRWSV